MNTSLEFAKLMRKKQEEINNNQYNGWDLTFITNGNLIDAVYMPGKQLVGSLYRVTIVFDDKDINNVQVEFPNCKFNHPFIDPITHNFCLPREDITAKTELKAILQLIHSAFIKPQSYSKFINTKAMKEFRENSVEFWKKIRKNGYLDDII